MARLGARGQRRSLEARVQSFPWLSAAVLAITVVVYIFLLSPIVVIMLVSVTNTNYVTFPPEGFTLRWYTELLRREDFLKSTVVSLEVGALAALLSTIMGTAASIAISRWRFPGRALISAFLLSPLLLPVVVFAIGFLRFLFVTQIGLTFAGMVIGHTVTVIPYTLRTVMSSLRSYDTDLEGAAQTLGASPLKAFWLVTLPLVRSGIIAGAIFAFIVSFDQFTLSVFISGTTTITLPLQLFEYARYSAEPVLASMGTVLIVSTIAIMLLIDRIFGIGEFARLQ